MELTHLQLSVSCQVYKSTTHLQLSVSYQVYKLTNSNATSFASRGHEGRGRSRHLGRAAAARQRILLSGCAALCGCVQLGVKNSDGGGLTERLLHVCCCVGAASWRLAGWLAEPWLNLR